MTRAGSASSSRSKSSNSTPEAFREKTLKFTPPGTIVAPKGALCPVSSIGISASDFTGAGGIWVLSRTSAMSHPWTNGSFAAVAKSANDREAPRVADEYIWELAQKKNKNEEGAKLRSHQQLASTAWRPLGSKQA